MNKIDLLKVGLPTEIEILSENSMSNILGGLVNASQVKCNKGYRAEKKVKCSCGYSYSD